MCLCSSLCMSICLNYKTVELSVVLTMFICSYGISPCRKVIKCRLTIKRLLRSRTGRRRASRTLWARTRRSTRAMRTRCRRSRATRTGLACICLDPVCCPLGNSVHQTLHVRPGKQREDTSVDDPQVVDTVDLELRVDNTTLLLW